MVHMTGFMELFLKPYIDLSYTKQNYMGMSTQKSMNWV